MRDAIDHKIRASRPLFRDARISCFRAEDWRRFGTLAQSHRLRLTIPQPTGWQRAKFLVETIPRARARAVSGP